MPLLPQASGSKIQLSTLPTDPACVGRTRCVNFRTIGRNWQLAVAIGNFVASGDAWWQNDHCQSRHCVASATHDDSLTICIRAISGHLCDLACGRILTACMVSWMDAPRIVCKLTACSSQSMKLCKRSGCSQRSVTNHSRSLDHQNGCSNVSLQDIQVDTACGGFHLHTVKLPAHNCKLHAWSNSCLSTSHNFGHPNVIDEPREDVPRSRRVAGSQQCMSPYEV